MKDLNNAFPETPEYVRSAIHLGLTKARRVQRLKRRLFMAASVAAVLAVMFGAFSLAVSARRFSGGLPRTPNPGPLAHGQATAEPTAARTPLPTPMPTPAAVRTLQPTPMPTAIVTAPPTAMPAVATEVPMKTFVTVLPTADYAKKAALPTPMSAAYYPAEAAVSEAELAAEVSEAAERIAYSTKNGIYYHSDWNCSGMLGASARTIPEAEALGQAACPICMPEEPTVWTTRAGKYYHDFENCSGMRYSVSMPESEALKSGRRLCPVCQANRARELPADLYSTDRGTYYHTDPACSGMLGAVLRSEEEVKRLGQKPCPTCVGG